MPVIKSAIKKLRKDKKRQLENKKIKDLLKKVLKEARKNVNEKNVMLAFSTVDKAVKKNIIHKNKAAHLKSQLSKKLAVKHPRPAAAKTPAKKPVAKARKTSKK